MIEEVKQEERKHEEEEEDEDNKGLLEGFEEENF